MNHAYRLVWNSASASYVPAPESARSRGKSGSMKTLVAAIALLNGACAFAAGVPANLPTGGQIVSGSGSIAGSGNTLTINQSSNKLIANWQGFDIGAGYAVNFNQPSANAVALNRVLGNNASQIYGSLNANGKVFLVNPNGVLFGAGASVNVGGLVASTLNITDNDFLNGNYVFTGKGRNSENAGVINAGTITAIDGGAVALLGGSVSNTGIIRAQLGKVVLGAGNKLSLDFAGDGLLALRVDESALNALVENHGAIVADGGQVLLTAKATDALLQTVVNNTGLIQAQTLQEQNGKIILMGGLEGGTTQVAGTLDASAPEAGNAGFIETSGAYVELANASVNLEAAHGQAGTWLIDPTDVTISQNTIVNGGSAGISLLVDGNFFLYGKLVTTGTVTLTVAGNVSQFSTGAITAGLLVGSSGGSTDLSLGTNQIAALGNYSAQDFHLKNNVSLVLTDGLGIRGNLALVAPGISSGPAGVIGVGGDSSFDAGSNAISLTNAGNQFHGVVSAIGGAVSLRDSGALQLGAITASSLTLQAGGAISQTAKLTVTGDSTLDAGSNVIFLADDSNDFGGAVSVTGDVVTLFDANALALGSVTASELMLSAGGAITQTAMLTVTGNSFFGADSNAIILNNAGNDFGGAVSVAGGEATLVDVNALVLGAVEVGALTINAGGTISDSNELSVGSFTLLGGNWVQNSAALPAFSATDFRLVGGTFLRVSGGNGSASSPYQLTDVYGLQGVNGFLGSSFALANSIDASVTAGWNGGAGFNPLGNASMKFTGVFDGLGHTISDLLINRPTQDYVGLFGSAQNAILRNVGLQSGSVTGRTAVGALAGIVNNSNITNSYSSTAVTGSANGFSTGGLIGSMAQGTLSNSYAEGAVTGGNGVGGLIGDIGSATVEASHASGEVKGLGQYIGGLIGHMNGGIVSRSYARGMVTGGRFDANGKPFGISGEGQRVGGLVGEMLGGTVTQSYSTSAVEAWTDVGGLIGRQAGTLTDSYATGSVKGNNAVGGLVGSSFSGVVQRTYASGLLTGLTERVAGSVTAANIGGLVGTALGAPIDSYWNTETSGITTGSLGVGKTTAELQQAATFANWDIDTAGGGNNVWRIYEGNSAPLLKAFLTTLNVSVSSDTVTYDGQSHGGTVSYTAQFPGLVLGNTQTSTYRNAGTYTLDLPSLYSTQRGYDIVSTGGTLTINKATLTISAATDSKTYDGSTNSSKTVVVSGLVAGDTLTGLAQTFASKNVLGTNGSTLQVNSGYVLNDGNNGGNYNVTINTAQGTITPAALTLNAVASSKTYDGNTSSATAVSVSGLVAGDNISGLTQSYDSKNAGDRVLSVDAAYVVNDGNNGGNYSVSTNTAQSSISKASLLLTAGTDSKVYDGGTSSAGTVGAAGLQGTDSVNAIQVFQSKHVLGNDNSTLLVDSYSIDDGNNGDNYIVTTQANTGSITPVALTIGVGDVSKVYDGKNTANASAIILAGTLQGSDTLGSGSYAFTDVNAGSNKTVTVAGFTVDDGNFGGNYTLGYVNNTTSEITPAALVIAASGDRMFYGRVYNGGNGVTYSGFVNGETEAVLAGVLAYTGNSQGATEVGDYVISPQGYGSSNYDITYVDAVLHITPPVFTLPDSPLQGHDAAKTSLYAAPPLPAPEPDTFVIAVQGDGLLLVAPPAAPAVTAVANEATATPATPRINLKDILPSDGSVLFVSNSASINEEEARRQLKVLAEHLKANPDEKVKLIGHTDSTGTERYNESLSERRANAVANVLLGLGVSAEQIVITGGGFRSPLDNNRNKTGRARNRRVDFALP